MSTAESQSPVLEGPLKVWRAHLGDGRLMLQHCASCNKAVFYPRVLCPHCGSDALSWKQSAGTGTVYSVTLVARKDRDGGPYNVVLVDLDEGVRMMSRIDNVANQDIRIGMRVSHIIGAIDEEPVVLFRPAA